MPAEQRPDRAGTTSSSQGRNTVRVADLSEDPLRLPPAAGRSPSALEADALDGLDADEEERPSRPAAAPTSAACRSMRPRIWNSIGAAGRAEQALRSASSRRSAGR